MTSVVVEKRKPCGAVRARWTAVVLGSDEWGDWFAVPDGTLLLPVADPWVARFRHDGTVRVDVATGVVAASPVSWFVDLDLDVERDATGGVHALDLADFVERSPSYPRAWVDLAREAWQDVQRDVAGHAEPFGAAPDLWLRRAARTTWPVAAAIPA
ncbi:hypothetical protein ATJ88_0285 [Isoptericola jiangsuensis]|uniref:DUF402 domain-containing protein n=1 Tax=Isoptericola jiangsuensis TaxID=548579 RepID=A0A2A9ESB9_9MICO|nr:hypothetical protein [Isoptericola jiangsuensis]PFG41643.1 hypothetical protein ATJ88_0285 [Isoptericola jiangsuensis]